MNRKHIPVMLTMILSLGVCLASDPDQNRIQRSYQVFSTGLDSLLLDTQHVFIQKGDLVKNVYIDDVGLIFTGNISMTGSGKFAIVMGDWERWFDKKDAETSPEETQKREKYISLYEKDKERLEQMDMHVSEFKRELATTVLDYCNILKGLKSNDHIIIIFFVKDTEFQEKYGSSALVLKANYKDLTQLDSKDPDSKTVKKVLQYNF